MTASLLTVDELGHTYGTGARAQVAIAELQFAVRDGEFVSIVGPSGCGTTTLLKCVSGLLPPTSGQVRLSGQTCRSGP